MHNRIWDEAHPLLFSGNDVHNDKCKIARHRIVGMEYNGMVVILNHYHYTHSKMLLNPLKGYYLTSRAYDFLNELFLQSV